MDRINQIELKMLGESRRFTNIYYLAEKLDIQNLQELNFVISYFDSLVLKEKAKQQLTDAMNNVMEFISKYNDDFSNDAYKIYNETLDYIFKTLKCDSIVDGANYTTKDLHIIGLFNSQLIQSTRITKRNKPVRLIDIIYYSLEQEQQTLKVLDRY